MNSSKGKLSSHGPWVHGHNFLPFCQAENRPPLTCFSALRLGFPIAAMQCLGLIAGTFSCTGGGGPTLGWEKKMLSDVYLLASERGSFFFSFFLLDMMTEELLCNLLHVGTMRLRLFAQEYSCDSWCDLWFTSGAQMMSLVEGMKFSLHAINLLRKLKLQEQWES